MRASIAKDSEGTGGASLLQMVGLLHAAIFGFCSGGAAQIGRCVRRLEKPVWAKGFCQCWTTNP